MTVSPSSPKLPTVVTHHLNQFDRSLASIIQSHHQLQTIELQLISSKSREEREQQPKFAERCQTEYKKVCASYDQFLKLEKRIEQIWENAKKDTTPLKGLADSKVQPYQAESPNHPIQVIKKKIEIIDTAILSLEAHTADLEQEISQGKDKAGLKERVDLFKEQILSRKSKFKQIADSLSKSDIPIKEISQDEKTAKLKERIKLLKTRVLSLEQIIDQTQRINLLKTRMLSLEQKLAQIPKSLSNTPITIEPSSITNNVIENASKPPHNPAIRLDFTNISPEKNFPSMLSTKASSLSLSNLNSVTTPSIPQHNTPIQRTSDEKDSLLKLNRLLKLPAIAIPTISPYLKTAEAEELPKYSSSSLPPIHPNFFSNFGQASSHLSSGGQTSPSRSSLKETRNRSQSIPTSTSFITALPSPSPSRSPSPLTPALFADIEESRDLNERRNSNEAPLARFIAPPPLGTTPEPTTTESTARSSFSNTDSSNDRSLASTNTPASSTHHEADLNTAQQVRDVSRPDLQKLLKPVFSYLAPVAIVEQASNGSSNGRSQEASSGGISSSSAQNAHRPDLQKLLKPVFSAPVKPAEEPNAKPAIDAANSYPYKTIGLIALVGASALAYKWYSK
jgi:hypothetical protein